MEWSDNSINIRLVAVGNGQENRDDPLIICDRNSRTDDILLSNTPCWDLMMNISMFIMERNMKLDDKK